MEEIKAPILIGGRWGKGCKHTRETIEKLSKIKKSDIPIIVDLYKRGYNLAYIAQKLHVDVSTITRKLQKHISATEKHSYKKHEDELNIIAMLNKGYSKDYIAKQYHYSESRLNYIFYKHKNELVKQRDKRKKLEDAAGELLIKCYEDGLTYAELCHKFNISSMTVYRLIKQYLDSDVRKHLFIKHRYKNKIKLPILPPIA